MYVLPSLVEAARAVYRYSHSFWTISFTFFSPDGTLFLKGLSHTGEL